MVALLIIGIGISSAVGLYFYTAKNTSTDERFKFALESADNYLTALYLSDDLADGLFSDEEIALINSAEEFPLLLDPEEIFLGNGTTLLVNKNIRRTTPLLVDIGVEMLIQYDETNRTSRSYWIETTLSESYLLAMNSEQTNSDEERDIE